MSNETTNEPAAEPNSSPSTGPRTEAGKAISSQNARKHDLCSKTLRLSADEWAEYHDMRARYGRDLQPADDLEETLVDEICFNYWRLQQTRDAELDIIRQHPTALALIALYIRYRTGYERAFYKALDQIQKRQRDRRNQASSQKPVTPEPLRSAKPETAVDSAPAPHLTDPVPLAAVRSAEPETAAESAPASRATGSVPSAEPSLSQELQEQIDDHAIENRVRAELCLPPLPLPNDLRQKVEHFVSQNPGSAADELRQALKPAA